MKHPRAEASGNYLRDVLRIDFTEEQLAIATHPLRPQLVIAGAGSGKTAVMAARVVHLVAWHEVSPGAILGLTFTNKAAAELADRVRGALAALGVDYVDDEPTVATYHSYADSLFRDHALRVGREPVAQLMTEAGRWQLAMRVVRAARGPFTALDISSALFVARYLLALDGEMAEHNASSDEVRACDARLIDDIDVLEASGQRAGQEVKKIRSTARARDELLDLVDDYRARKRDLDLIDFGDQVAIAAEIATRCEAVVRLERARFAAVLLDEYQDTGVAQRVLLSALFGDSHPVTAVGDPCQSIYGWRGASVGNLVRFGEHFGSCEPQFLMTNFRSGGRLLPIANDISAPLREQRSGHRPHIDVPMLEAQSGRDRDGDAACALVLTADDEADWVAGKVAQCVESGATSPGGVAVLARRRRDFARLHAALVARGLPVEVVELGGLLTMPEVADVVATLEVLSDPTANPALLRLLTGARWRIGARDLAALGRRAAVLASRDRARFDADEDPDGRRALAAATESVDPCDVAALVDALDDLGDPAAYSVEAFARLQALARELRDLRSVVAQPVVEAVHEVITRIGIDVEIAASPDAAAPARAANLTAFLDHAARFVGIDGSADVPAFLAYLSAAREAEDGLELGTVSTADTVKLLTVHQAKGLEWDVVAVTGLCGEVFPTGQGRPRWTTRAAVLPSTLRGDREDLPAEPAFTRDGLKRFVDECNDDQLDEERRLAYVAVTRARRVLLASGYHWSGQRQKPHAESPFLAAVRDACIAGAGSVDRWVAEPGEQNPLADRLIEVGWPAPYDEDALAARRQAAELVQQALEKPQAPPATGVAARWRRDTDLVLDEIRRDRDPVRLVPLPRSLTVSQLQLLARDPDELARVLARPLPRRPSAAARRGTRFHAWLEELGAAGQLIPLELDEASVDAALDDSDLAALRTAFRNSPYAEQVPHAVEVPFELVVGGHVLRGRIDAVYRTADGYDVIDYKTGLRATDMHNAALQLAAYRLAWAELSGTPLERVGAAFLYVAHSEVVRPERLPDRAELAAMLDPAVA